MYIRSLFTTLALFLLTACGGDKLGSYANGGGRGGGTTAGVEGNWSGSYVVPGDPRVVVYGAVVTDGYAFFYDTKGILYVLPQLDGGPTVSGTLTSYAPVGLQFEDGSTRQTFQLSGTVSDSAITGTFTGNGITATFSLAPYSPLNVNPSVVAGNWQGYYLGSHSVAMSLTVQSGGAFVGNDSDGCSIVGSISPHASGEDIFGVSLTSSGGPLCYGTLAGLAFESNTDVGGLFGGTTGTYYYLDLSNGTGAYTIELKVQ